ncbi:Eukaryotic translation initiation factor 2A [Trichinella nativa]|uniref:Eukaryotic translation initiation factor 2A n=1 Tax=Trichinella nativa TaxID=6335 RepID=A0A0V1LSP8_9BILA|nr:Eukaryotic translation initiation factor 2A [Trichinella nativa]
MNYKDEIEGLKKWLLGDDRVKKMRALRKLETLPITLEILQQTGIGIALNSLRNEKEYSERVKTLVFKWKEIAYSTARKKGIEIDFCETTANKYSVKPRDAIVAESAVKITSSSSSKVSTKPDTLAKCEMKRSADTRSTEDALTSEKESASAFKVPKVSKRIKLTTGSDSFADALGSVDYLPKNYNRSHKRKLGQKSKQIPNGDSLPDVEILKSLQTSLNEPGPSNQSNMYFVKADSKPPSYNKTKTNDCAIKKSCTMKGDYDYLDQQLVKRGHSRTQVYSGRRSHTVQSIQKLFDMCIRVLSDNIDQLEFTGGVPYSILRPVLSRASPQQLVKIEHYNPYLSIDLQELWKEHCKKEFNCLACDLLKKETYRQMYERMVMQREQKFLEVTRSISESMNNANVRVAKLSEVKTPRDVLRRQAKYGTGLLALPSCEDIIESRRYGLAGGGSSSKMKSLASSSRRSETKVPSLQSRRCWSNRWKCSKIVAEVAADIDRSIHFFHTKIHVLQQPTDNCDKQSTDYHIISATVDNLQYNRKKNFQFFKLNPINLFRLFLDHICEPLNRSVQRRRRRRQNTARRTEAGHAALIGQFVRAELQAQYAVAFSGHLFGHLLASGGFENHIPLLGKAAAAGLGGEFVRTGEPGNLSGTTTQLFFGKIQPFGFDGGLEIYANQSTHSSHGRRVGHAGLAGENVRARLERDVLLTATVFGQPTTDQRALVPPASDDHLTAALGGEFVAAGLHGYDGVGLVAPVVTLTVGQQPVLLVLDSADVGSAGEERRRALLRGELVCSALGSGDALALAVRLDEAAVFGPVYVRPRTAESAHPFLRGEFVGAGLQRQYRLAGVELFKSPLARFGRNRMSTDAEKPELGRIPKDDRSITVYAGVSNPVQPCLYRWSNVDIQIFVYKCSKWRLHAAFDENEATNLFFSPKNSVLCTFKPYSTAVGVTSVESNLKLWSMFTGELLCEWVQKNIVSWRPMWTADESIVLRLVGSELWFIAPENLNRFVQKLTLPKLTSFSLSPGPAPFHVAVYTASSNEKMASARLYRCSLKAPIDIIACKNFQADRVDFHWNKNGTAVLVMAILDVDPQNKSYYGCENLHLMTTYGEACNVPLDREGPIHSVDWHPGSKLFCVVYGYIPSKAALFDLKANRVCDFDTTFFEISPDGIHFITATTSPRLRVSNGLKIWHCSGKVIHEINCIDETLLWQVIWSSEGKDKFPKPVIDLSSFQGAKAVQQSAYVPPHLRGTIKAEPAKSSLGEVDSRFNGDESASKKKKNVGFKKDHHGNFGKLLNTVNTKATDKGERMKKIRSLQTKLRQIKILKDKQSQGCKLELNQIEKINREEEIQAQLEQLTITGEDHG